MQCHLSLELPSLLGVILPFFAGCFREVLINEDARALQVFALSRTASLSFSRRNLTTMGRGFSDAAIGFLVLWAQSSSIFKWSSCSFSLSNFLTFSSDSDTFSFPDSLMPFTTIILASWLALQIFCLVWDWNHAFANCVQVCPGFTTVLWPRFTWDFKIIKFLLSHFQTHLEIIDLLRQIISSPVWRVHYDLITGFEAFFLLFKQSPVKAFLLVQQFTYLSHGNIFLSGVVRSFGWHGHPGLLGPKFSRIEPETSTKC